MICLRIVFATLVAVSACSSDIAKGDLETEYKLRAASALFRQFETVAYISTDILSSLVTQGSNGGGTNQYQSLTLRLPFVQLIGGLKILGRDTVADLGRSYGSVLVGAKDFRAPQGLGMVSSTECYIGISKGGTPSSIDADFKHTMQESMNGIEVWTWSAPPYEGYPHPTTFYAAQVGRYFVMANNRRDFEQAARSLIPARSPASMRVADWNTLTVYNYWVRRSIHWARMKDDAT